MKGDFFLFINITYALLLAINNPRNCFITRMICNFSVSKFLDRLVQLFQRKTLGLCSIIRNDPWNPIRKE